MARVKRLQDKYVETEPRPVDAEEYVIFALVCAMGAYGAITLVYSIGWLCGWWSW